MRQKAGGWDMSEERRRDNASEKGNGNPYYERALKREQEMTPEEKAKQEKYSQMMEQVKERLGQLR